MFNTQFIDELDRISKLEDSQPRLEMISDSIISRKDSPKGELAKMLHDLSGHSLPHVSNSIRCSFLA